jgi:hypothetical protein
MPCPGKSCDLRFVCHLHFLSRAASIRPSQQRLLAMVTLSLFVQYASSSERRPVARERLPQRSQHMHVLGTEPSRKCRPPSTRPVRYPMIDSLFRVSLRQVLCPLNTKAHATLFDKGFVDRAVVHDETSSGRETRSSQKTEELRTIHATLVQRGDALCAGGER